MEIRSLGDSGIKVSRLCYGSLTFSFSQANLSAKEGGELILYAADKGVNFVDTAQLYGTYPQVAYAIKKAKSPLVISTKSYAYDRQSAVLSVEKARKEMGLDVIDIFMLHEQESAMTMLGHMQALEYYLEMKSKGVIRAVGLSTHAIEPIQSIVQAKLHAKGGHTISNCVHIKNDLNNCASHNTSNFESNFELNITSNTTTNSIINSESNNILDSTKNREHNKNNIISDNITDSVSKWKNHWSEFDPSIYSEIDIVHPILNMSGIGLLDGTADDMLSAVQIIHSLGVGVFGMKMLGGGNLLCEFEKAVKYALSIESADSYAVGMQSKDEIDMNVALFEDRFVEPSIIAKTKQRKRRLMIEDWCNGCGKCLELCNSNALSIINGQASVNPDKCVLCSYCSRGCRDFAIKVV